MQKSALNRALFLFRRWPVFGPLSAIRSISSCLPETDGYITSFYGYSSSEFVLPIALPHLWYVIIFKYAYHAETFTFERNLFRCVSKPGSHAIDQVFQILLLVLLRYVIGGYVRLFIPTCNWICV